MDKKKIMKILKNYSLIGIETALPELINMLPEIFINGFCVSLPVVGNFCLSFKQNRDARILNERVDDHNRELEGLKERINELNDVQKEQTYSILKNISEYELAYPNNVYIDDVYKIDYMEFILDESYDYDYSCFEGFVQNLEPPINNEPGYIWMSGNKITINIAGHIMKYSSDFQYIIDNVNEALFNSGVSSYEEPVKAIRCY